jgi:spore coat polysaccharide biosynthesis protein SpsF
MDVEVFSFKALKTAYNEAKQQYQREHVTPFIWENARRFKLHNIKWEHDGSKVRLTVDTQEDLDLILAINDILIEQGKALESATLDDIMEILNKNPVLLKINAHVEQKSHKEVELKKGPKITVPISKRSNKR